MGIEKRIESFIQRTIWKLTRSGDIIKLDFKKLTVVGQSEGSSKDHCLQSMTL